MKSYTINRIMKRLSARCILILATIFAGEFAVQNVSGDASDVSSLNDASNLNDVNRKTNTASLKGTAPGTKKRRRLRVRRTGKRQDRPADSSEERMEISPNGETSGATDNNSIDNNSIDNHSINLSADDSIQRNGDSRRKLSTDEDSTSNINTFTDSDNSNTHGSLKTHSAQAISNSNPLSTISPSRRILSYASRLFGMSEITDADGGALSSAENDSPPSSVEGSFFEILFVVFAILYSMAQNIKRDDQRRRISNGPQND
jgi:hypothetical protein